MKVRGQKQDSTLGWHTHPPFPVEITPLLPTPTDLAWNRLGPTWPGQSSRPYHNYSKCGSRIMWCVPIRKLMHSPPCWLHYTKPLISPVIFFKRRKKALVDSVKSLSTQRRHWFSGNTKSKHWVFPLRHKFPAALQCRRGVNMLSTVFRGTIFSEETSSNENDWHWDLWIIQSNQHLVTGAALLLLFLLLFF